MVDAVIVDAVRTPGGRRNGQLRGWHPVDLAAETLKALQARNDFDPAIVEDVFTGCVMQVAEQSLNVGRNAVLAAGWPESVPATTIDRQCGSSQQSLHFAAQGIMAGQYDVVIANGVEAMSRVPMGSSVVKGMGFPFGPAMFNRYATIKGNFNQGLGAEMIADGFVPAKARCQAECRRQVLAQPGFVLSAHLKRPSPARFCFTRTPNPLTRCAMPSSA